MWKFSTTLQRRWSGSHGSLRSTTQIPLQGSTSSSFAGSTVSRPPIAVCCLWELPQLQGTAQLRSHPLVVLPISNDQPVQDDEVVLLPTSGQLWRSFWSQSSQVVGQGCCWIWITTQFFLLSIPAVFPLFYKYWFLQALCLLTILQVMLHLRVCILENPGWDAPLPNSVCPPKPFFTEYLMSTDLGNILMLVSMSVRTKCLCGMWGRGAWAWTPAHESFAIWNQVNIEMMLFSH